MGKYKLLGMFWDGRKNSFPRRPKIKTEDEIGYCEDYRVGRNLFDFDVIRRKIKYSELLRCERREDFSDIANRLQWCDSVYLVADYIPQNISPVMEKFYFKTLLSACEFVRSIKKGLSVVMVMSEKTRRRAVPYFEHYLRRES